MLTVILNRRLTSSIQYHDTLHSFRMRRGTGKASHEAKLLQQLIDVR